MGNIVPIRPGIHPAGQTAAPSSSSISPWLVLGIAFVGIVAYEGINYMRYQQTRGMRRNPSRRRRRYT